MFIYSKTQVSADSGQDLSDSDIAAHNGTDFSLSPAESAPFVTYADGTGVAVSTAMSSSTSSSPVFNLPNDIVYRFKVPNELCGQLIGSKGHTIKSFKTESRTNIVIIDGDSFEGENKVCQISGKLFQYAVKQFNFKLPTLGSSVNVEKALGLIRKRFPISIYPNMTMESIGIMQSRQPVPVLTLSQSCWVCLFRNLITLCCSNCCIPCQ